VLLKQLCALALCGLRGGHVFIVLRL
jgi:hypothetical protein